MDEAYMGQPVDDFTCISGTWDRNYLTVADCSSGQTCVPFLGYAITAQLPGQCEVAK